MPGGFFVASAFKPGQSPAPITRRIPMIPQVITILLVLLVLGYSIHSKRKIMSKITDAQAAVKAAFDKANASLTGIQSDVTSLKAKIDALQNSTGELSPEDQAALDDIQAQADSLAAKVATIDELTPPDATEAQPGE